MYLRKKVFYLQNIKANCESFVVIQGRIAQLVAYPLGTGEVPGLNPGRGEKFSVKIINWIVRIRIRICNSLICSGIWLICKVQHDL